MGNRRAIHSDLVEKAENIWILMQVIFILIHINDKSLLYEWICKLCAMMLGVIFDPP